MKSILYIVLLIVCHIIGYAQSSFKQEFKDMTLINGINGHPLTSKDYYQKISFNNQFKLLYSLGITFYRFDVEIGYNGQILGPNSRIDSMILLSKKYNIGLLPCIYLNSLAKNNISYSTAFLMGKNMALYYKNKIDHFEIGNEMDLFLMNKQNINYSNNVYTLLKGIVDGIKAANVNGKSIIDVTNLSSDFMNNLSFQNIEYDIQGLHVYQKNTNFSNLNAMINKYSSQTNAKPIWITEYNILHGTAENSFSAQKKWLKYFKENITAVSSVKAIFFYELFDEDAKANWKPNHESTFGLLKYDQMSNSYVPKY